MANPFSIAWPRLLRLLLPALGALVLAGCGKKDAATANPGAAAPKLSAANPLKVRFQTDWYPQGEHGGFYQALAKGFYKEAGLEVEILPGGPGATVAQKLVAGVADFGMSRSDDAAIYVQTGLPLLLVHAYMQHDPQAILLHEENPVSSFKELDGKTIMAVPGSNWIDFLKKRYQIEFAIIPSNFGLGQFMADKAFIQQSYITNEPYYVRQNGAKPKTLLIADSGFDPYRVVLTTQRFAREQPEAVRAFVAATIRGWIDYMDGDPAPAFAAIAARNDKMTPEFLNFTRTSLAENRLIAGHPDRGEAIGQLSRERLQAQVNALVELKLLSAPVPLEKFVGFEFQPETPAR